jgi:hypothetical protein
MPFTLNGEALAYGQSFTIADVQYPANVPDLWSRADLEALGLVWTDPPEPSAPTLEALRDQANAAVNAKREAVFAAGFLVSGGALDGQHLQLRNADDKANWLIVDKNARAAVAAGAGDAPLIPIRTLENQTVTVTPNQALAVLAALESWGGAVMAHSWTLKDAITAAADEASLAAIDLDAGWP